MIKDNILTGKHYHLMGIGGIGMSAIAHILLKRGYEVTGCDVKENEFTRELKKEGAFIWCGHDIRHLERVDILVYSSAIPIDNPEVMQAKRKGIQLVRRAEILAGLMKDKTVITVTGMHGKTTTTALAAYLFKEAGLSPSSAIGGVLYHEGNALYGNGRYFVAEADESDGSFLCYHPDYSIITNIDYEHLDYYKDFGNILEFFRNYINQTQENGCLFYWKEDLHLKPLLSDYRKKTVSFGFSPQADIYAVNIALGALKSEFDCFLYKKFIGRFEIRLGGRHNILNALSVIALGLELGLDIDVIKTACLNYKGTKRRLEIKFESSEYLVLDDYGHHPTEIKATLEAVRLLNPGRLVVIFQPHRYSRTKFLLDSFADSFYLADQVIITDIYTAAEAPIAGVSGYSLYEKLKNKNHPDPRFLHKDEIYNHIIKDLKKGDTILVLGAGDITKISDELADFIKRETQKERTACKAY